MLGSILDDFDQVPTFAIFEWGEEPVIDGHEIEAGETVEQPGVGAIAASDGELMEQSGGSDIISRVALAAGALDERTAEIGFPDPGRSSYTLRINTLLR